MRRGLLLLSLVVVATPAQAAKPRVQTLVRAQAEITAFAQDGRYVAWATTPVVRCGYNVVVRDLTGRQEERGACGSPEARQLAVANGEVLWWKRFEFGGQQHHDLLAMSLRGFHDLVFRGQWPRRRTVEFSLVGDGAVLGYGMWFGGPVDPKACASTGKHRVCRRVVKGGGLYRVRGTRSRRVRGVPPMRLAAAAAGRIALVAAGTVGRVATMKMSSVIVYDAAVGSLGRPTSLRGRVRGLAFDGRRVAVFVHDALIVWVQDRSPPVFERHRLPTRAMALAMSKDAIVYRVGRSIRVVGRGEVARAAAEPIGLSIDGRRIAWAENVNGRGRIQSLRLRR